ncbi:LysE family translocator [Pseudomonas oryzihabitans]|uniref:LysE family translocator n=1 Tax=Pseudomonas oryzihabitans TaxID=47885 RepID=UPI00214E4118|nr:LysE family translocator [Pseudomonas psychrotolerans]UUW72628.1 LysE family translocator [Pseudomonas psychrotolerans]
MQHFALYLLLCGLTIASPGPGVLLTITNALQLRLRGALPGILGVVLGILLVAILASTALGALVSSSPRTLQGLQLVGALYLGWLGLRRLRSPAAQGRQPAATWPSVSVGRHLLQGLLVSLTNPKLIIFFLALFPPFIQADRPVLPQLAALVASFCLLSLIIHCSYAAAVTALNGRLTSGTTLARLNQVAGGLFLVLAALLLGAALDSA